jgi:hypothetical protein
VRNSLAQQEGKIIHCFKPEFSPASGPVLEKITSEPPISTTTLAADGRMCHQSLQFFNQCASSAASESERSTQYTHGLHAVRPKNHTFWNSYNLGIRTEINEYITS